MSTSQEIRIGLAGLGSRGLYWLSLLRKIKGFRVVALCDSVTSMHASALKALGDDAAGVRCYADYRAMLDDKTIDAVASTVRCKEQGALAAMAMEAGKHVHSEVPAAHSLEDCWRIVLAAERSGKTYMLGEQLRYAGFVSDWRDLVASGELGKVTYAEGQYFHYYVGKTFRDPATGEFFGPGGLAKHPNAVPTWLNGMPPIHYIVHDFSPLLRVMDDRAVEVFAMSTDSPSAAHPEVKMPDMQVALMKTAKGAIMRMAASFAQPHPEAEYHWTQVIGTKGSIEWQRSAHDKPKHWHVSWNSHDKRDAAWQWSPDPTKAPPEARESGHGGLDYYPHAAFRDAILHGVTAEFDVYRAMDVAAPAALAEESINRGGVKMIVPDFRPSASRPKGRAPRA